LCTRRQGIGIAIVGGVRKNSGSQRLLLCPISLIAEIKRVLELGVRSKQGGVEMRGDCQAMLTQHWHTRIDIGTYGFGQHAGSLDGPGFKFQLLHNKCNFKRHTRPEAEN
jgi:hypothetical protein